MAAARASMTPPRAAGPPSAPQQATARPMLLAQTPQRKYAEPTSNFGCIFKMLNDAIEEEEDTKGLVSTVRTALAEVHAQFRSWTVDLSEHAVGLELHHTSLCNASVAVGQARTQL